MACSFSADAPTPKKIFFYPQIFDFLKVFHSAKMPAPPIAGAVMLCGQD